MPAFRNPAPVIDTDFGRMMVHPFDTGVQAALTDVNHCNSPHAEIKLLSYALSNRGAVDAVIVDVGANVGAFSLGLLPWIGEKGRLIVFEPQPPIFNMLAGNMALNGVLNVRCIWAAVGSKIGSTALPQFDYTKALSYGSVEFGPEQREQLTQNRMPDCDITVPLVTLDSLKLQKIDLLKIDVEGMELDVLAGAKDSIRRCRPIIYAEWLKTGREPLARALTALKYDLISAPHENFLAIPT